MNQKEEIIKIYQKEDIAKTFDEERFEHPYQRYKNFIEAKFLIDTLKIAFLKKDKIKVLNKTFASSDSLKKTDSELVKVLDVACGTGRMLDAIKKSCVEVEYTGLDTSKAMTKRLLERAKKLGISASVKIGDATSMPFKDNSFDVVYTYHLTWHLPQELQEKMIREMIRVVKKEGYIVFDVLNANFLWEKIKGLFGRKPTEGIYKMKISDVKRIMGERNYPTEKLSDFPIKNDFVYSLVNILNVIRKMLPSPLFHMVYFRVKK